MNTYQLAYLGMKAISVYLAIQALDKAGRLLELFSYSAQYGGFYWNSLCRTVLTSIGPFLIFTAAGLLIWVYTDRIAKRIAPKEADASWQIKGQDLLRTGIALLGLCSLVYAVNTLFWVGRDWIGYGLGFSASNRELIGIALDALFAGGRMVLSFLLVIKAGWITSRIYRAWKL
ncbi:hypothetical protein [Paenibacillus sp. y28]|uniref:hypothetical protein n=1 Tax=Paenibacillus sp. y28 TaxID=3129110 RepID=UPI003018BB31